MRKTNMLTADGISYQAPVPARRSATEEMERWRAEGKRRAAGRQTTKAAGATEEAALRQELRDAASELMYHDYSDVEIDEDDTERDWKEKDFQKLIDKVAEAAGQLHDSADEAGAQRLADILDKLAEPMNQLESAYGVDFSGVFDYDDVGDIIAQIGDEVAGV